MPRKKSLPAYRLHRPSRLARVIVAGKHVYLGPYGSDESRVAYARVIAEHCGNPLAELPPAADGFPDVSVAEVLVRYLGHARGHYARDGRPTSEYRAMRDAVVPLRMLFAALPARDFGPLRLKEVQQRLVDEGRRCRSEINKQIKRIRRVFAWAVGEELIPSAVHAALQAVRSLKRGRTTARETEKVRPVDDAVVEATLPYLSPQVAAMVRVQRLTGARPGEIVVMRVDDIDRSDDVWLYRPQRHKNDWRDQPRVVALGPRAQEVLRPFLDRPGDAYLFSPREAEAWRNEERVEARDPHRRTPVYPSELRARERRRAAARRRMSKRPKRDRYDRDSYRRAVAYAVARANRCRSRLSPPAEPLPGWFPNQLRHTAGTETRRVFGVEGARLSLGNSADVVEIDAERDLGHLKAIARRLG